MLSTWGLPGQPVIHPKAGSVSASQWSQAQGFLELPTFLPPGAPERITSHQLSKALPHRASFMLGAWHLLKGRRWKHTQLWATESSLTPKTLPCASVEGRREARWGRLSEPRSNTFSRCTALGRVTDLRVPVSPELYSVQSVCEPALFNPHSCSVMEETSPPFTDESQRGEVSYL